MSHSLFQTLTPFFYVRFRCKSKCKIWRANILRESGSWKWTMLLYVRKSCHALPASRSCWGNSICTTISSVLLILYRHCPRLGVEVYRLNATLCQPVGPYLCPNMGVLAHQAEARIGGHIIFLLAEFNGCGAASSILEFLCLRANK
jgi:hypothetical protein